jgi:hypothetical protein
MRRFQSLPLRLNTSIMLMPLTFPPRYGAMRKAVYAAGAAQLLGPRESPNSWESIPPHELEGTLFDGSRKLEMTCIVRVYEDRNTVR